MRRARWQLRRVNRKTITVHGRFVATTKPTRPFLRKVLLRRFRQAQLQRLGRRVRAATPAVGRLSAQTAFQPLVAKRRERLRRQQRSGPRRAVWVKLARPSATHRLHVRAAPRRLGQRVRLMQTLNRMSPRRPHPRRATVPALYQKTRRTLPRRAAVRAHRLLRRPRPLDGQRQYQRILRVRQYKAIRGVRQDLKVGQLQRGQARSLSWIAQKGRTLLLPLIKKEIQHRRRV